MNKIWALILAAGESKRMGFPKMLLDFGGITMLERVIENVKGSDVDQIMVVLGAEHEKLKIIMRNLMVSFCYNEKFADGMLSSVKCGFNSIPVGYRAVLVFQGDQPLIKSDLINSVIKAYRSSGYGLIMPVCNGKRGHPLLIDNKYNAEIKLLDSSEGLRSLAVKFAKDVLEIETGDEGILRDFDTYDEYRSAINQKL